LVDRLVAVTGLLSLLAISVLKLGLVSLGNSNPSLSSVLDVFLNISYSVFAAVVFYMATAYFPRREDLRRVGRFADKESRATAGRILCILDDFARAAGVTPPRDRRMTHDEIKSIFDGVDPNGQANVLVSWNPRRYATFLESAQLNSTKARTHAQRALRLMPFLDSEHLELLCSIEDAMLHLVLQPLPGPISNKNCSFFAKEYIESYELARNLVYHLDQKKALLPILPLR
jgi:hypothetical protein